MKVRFTSNRQKKRIEDLAEDLNSCSGNIFKFKAKMRALDKAMLNESVDSQEENPIENRKVSEKRPDRMDKVTYTMLKRQETPINPTENDIYTDFMASGFYSKSNLPEILQTNKSPINSFRGDLHGNKKAVRNSDNYLQNMGIERESFIGKRLNHKTESVYSRVSY